MENNVISHFHALTVLVWSMERSVCGKLGTLWLVMEFTGTLSILVPGSGDKAVVKVCYK